jgi:PBP1b-binding outer membrane lipoprotein LpoB
MKKILILLASSVILSGCWLNNSGAWKSSGTTEPVKTADVPTVAPSAIPTQTVEELGAETDTVLSAEMDADFKSIETDLKRLDEELKSY